MQTLPPCSESERFSLASNGRPQPLKSPKPAAGPDDTLSPNAPMSRRFGMGQTGLGGLAIGRGSVALSLHPGLLEPVEPMDLPAPVRG